MSAEEASWAATGARLSAPDMPPGLADVASDPRGARRLPWLSPVWDAGEKGRNFVPGFVRKHVAFWGNVILEDHPLRDTFRTYVTGWTCTISFSIRTRGHLVIVQTTLTGSRLSQRLQELRP